MNNITDKRVEHVAFGLGAIALTALFVKSASALLSTKDVNEKSVPTIPYRFPFIGSTFAYYANPLAFTRSKTAEYGSLFYMHMHGQLTTVVGAEDAPEVFNNPMLSFTASQSKFFSNSLFHGSGKFTLPENIVQNSIMKHLTPNLKEYSPRSFERFLQESDRLLGDLSEPKLVDDLLPFMRSFVARYSACAFVGVNLSNNEDLINAFEHSVADIGKEFRPGAFRVVFPLFNSLYMRVFYPYAGTIKKYRELIKGALKSELISREANKNDTDGEKSSDLLQYLLDEYPHEIDNDHLETLTSVILILIFVGVHTTTDAVTYTMYTLVKRPEYIQELLEEQEEIIDTEPDVQTSSISGDIIFTPNMYRRMVKLDSFIREAMRVRMIGIGLGHTNISGHDIVLKSGAIIKPEQEVFINMWHIHNDEKNQSYMPDLDKFEGFRFAGNDKLVTKAGHDNVSFGMGK
ncbi:unnamed protein product [Mucor hiemalis]